jgi:hypothetical protein
VNINIPAQEIDALHMSPTHKGVILFKTAPINITTFQKFMDRVSLNKTVSKITARAPRVKMQNVNFV